MDDRLRVIERRDVDELIILDVAATPENRGPRFDEISRFCENLFCPVTVGGGVRNVNDIARLLRSGADKVAVNTVAIERPELVSEAAQRFGSQAIVASIDVRGGLVASCCGSVDTDRPPVAWAHELDRDGTLSGYDLDLIEEIAGAVSIPVIACGGCGSYEHMHQALSAGAHAVAAGAMFQFTETTPKGASRHLKAEGFHTRA
jgi:cyclase